MIGIVDYGLGNILAFANIYKSLNMPFKIINKLEKLTGISKIILPGVGSFDHAMEKLNSSGMRESLDELVLNKKVPVIGICVGMQILADSSDEGEMSGLGWIHGHVKKFDKNIDLQKMPLPHMGWNSISFEINDPLFSNLEDNPRFYFLHSYYFTCKSNKNVLATSNYGDRFSSVVKKNNIYGIQCHPEKSHSNGVSILRNFAELSC